MRTSLSIITALLLAAPLSAQGKDATKAVGSAPLPAGWVMKMDPGSESMTAKMVKATSGFEITSGGAAIYYSTADRQANDKFTTMADIRQLKKNVGHGEHGEAFGLFVGGQNLDDPAKQSYFYFLVRQDGQYLINRRAGKEVHKLVDWTASPAVIKFDDKPNASNSLEIHAAMDSVRFVVNGKQVFALSRKNVDVSGQTGIRVNHNLDVQVWNFMAMKGM
jgi:hypothetical protein